MPKLTIEQKRKEAVAALLKNMEAIAADMRALIVGMPPKDLLGYIYAQRFMRMTTGSGEPLAEHDTNGPSDTINEFQFLLEYVHAVLASDAAPDKVQFDEAKCAELFELSSKLKEQAMFFAMGSSADTGRSEERRVGKECR